MKKLLALGIVTFFVAGATQVLANQPVVLKLASFVSPKSVNNTVTVPAFIAAVEKASEGTLKIELYPGGTLGSSPKSQIKLVEDGVVDIAEVVADYTPGRFPEFSLFSLPFEFSSSEEAGLTAWVMYEKGLFTGMENLEVLGIIQAGPYTIHSSKDISTPEKMKGLKLRAAGPIQGQIIEKLNAIPIGGISGPKVAEAISRKVLDGSLMDNTNVFNFRIADATKYHVLNVQLGNVAVFYPMNKAKFDSLPEKAKAALNKYKGEWFSSLLNKNLDDLMAKGVKMLKDDPKHTVFEWSPEEIAAVKSEMSSIKNDWDKVNDQGVNLYQEMLKARESVRAKM